jgi:hypothetical protein
MERRPVLFKYQFPVNYYCNHQRVMTKGTVKNNRQMAIMFQ